MKIAIASSGLGHVSRGMETWAESLAEALNEVGIKVTLFRGRGPKRNKYDAILPTLNREWPITKSLAKLTSKGGWRIGLGAPHSVESFIFGLQLLYRLRVGYDIIHVQQGSLALFLQRASRIGLMNTSLIFGNGQKASPEFLNVFEYINFLSPYDQHQTVQQVPDRPGWRVIPNFVDTEQFRPMDKRICREKFGLPQNSIVILTVGMIDTQTKRMNYFIEEAALLLSLTKLPVHFVLAGSKHSDTGTLVSRGKRLLDTRVTFLLDLPRQEMPMLYNCADIFTLCSFREALGLAIVEAMACGIPAICHDFPIMKWVVQEGGEVVDMKNRFALSNILKKYCEDSTLLGDKGQLARKRVEEEFSKSLVVAKLIDMYRHIIDKA